MFYDSSLRARMDACGKVNRKGRSYVLFDLECD
jgi:ribosomal protein L36